jgi:hypothetical protein
MFKSEKLNLWENCESVLLEKNFRQKEGPWLEMLNRFRVGEATDEDIKILESRPSSLLSPAEYNQATHLCYTNVEVNKHNTDMINILEEIKEEIKANLQTPHNYKAKVNSNGNIDTTQFVMNLILKKGARVMVVSNIDIKDSLVNGSLGMILDIQKNEESGKDCFLIRSRSVSSNSQFLSHSCYLQIS